MSTADALSLSRIPLAAAFLLIYSPDSKVLFLLAFAIIVIALATDFLDGYNARRSGTTSRRGYLLDGLGDRSVYIALILTIHSVHSPSIILTWLLVFREVAVYGVRLLVTNWYSLTPQVRHLSQIHALLLRLWILSFFLIDADSLFFRSEILSYRQTTVWQWLLALATLIVAYYAVARLVRISFQQSEES